MRQKEHMENRIFRPIKLSDSLKGVNKSLENKFGKTHYIINSKWAEIVGTFFFQYSKPEKITSIRKPDMSGGNKDIEYTLHVNLAPAAAVEFQHFQNKIIEKINTFFGYKAIHRIKIHQLFSFKYTYNSKEKNKKNNKNLLNQKKIQIKDTTQKINDKELEQSLLNLGLSIAENE